MHIYYLPNYAFKYLFILLIGGRFDTNWNIATAPPNGHAWTPALTRCKPSTFPFTAQTFFSWRVSSLFSWLWNPKETGIYLNNEFMHLALTKSEYLICSNRAGAPGQLFHSDSKGLQHPTVSMFSPLLVTYTLF